MPEAVVEENTCRQCGGNVSECGPLVKGGIHGESFIGLRHLPNVAGVDRRRNGRHFANA